MTNYIIPKDQLNGYEETDDMIDPLSSGVFNWIGLPVGAAYGYLSTKGKDKKKRLISAAIWGVAGKFLPLPVIGYAGYKVFVGDVKIPSVTD